MTARIRLRRNGPYVIEGDDIEVVDWNGVPLVADRKPLALCRCGASARKPFCDGSHARIGFEGESTAAGQARHEEAPAQPKKDGN